MANLIHVPAITNPSLNQKTGLNITLTSTSFNSPSDEHISTDWQISTDSNFNTIVWQSINSNSKESIAVTLPSFSTTYYARVKYNGNYVSSNYSDTLQFSTRVGVWSSWTCKSSTYGSGSGNPYNSLIDWSKYYGSYQSTWFSILDPFTNLSKNYYVKNGTTIVNHSVSSNGVITSYGVWEFNGNLRLKAYGNNVYNHSQYWVYGYCYQILQ